MSRPPVNRSKPLSPNLRPRNQQSAAFKHAAKKANTYRLQQRNRQERTLRAELSHTRSWCDEYRRFLRRSGVTRAVVVDSGTPESARIYVEVTSNHTYSGAKGALILGALALNVGFASLHAVDAKMALLIAFAVWCASFGPIALFCGGRRYRVEIPFKTWCEKPDHLVQLAEVLGLAAQLDRGQDSTNAALCRAMQETGCAEKLRKRSNWDMFLLRMKKRAAR